MAQPIIHKFIAESSGVERFGERLRREREMRGITLEEIADATKIGTRSLRALEEDDFSKLPGGIFNKGFVRAYARHLGMDQDQAAADYEAAMGEPRQQQTPIAQVIAAQGAEPREEEHRSESTAPPWAGMIIVLALAVAAAAGWTVFSRYQQARSHTQQTPAKAPEHVQEARIPTAESEPSPGTEMAAGAAPAETAAEANPGAAPAEANTESPPRPPERLSIAAAPVPAKSKASRSKSSPIRFEVHIRAVQTAWVKIVADGREVMAENLEARKEKSVRASEKVVLTTGNAAGVAISFNGKPIALSGEEGKVTTISFNAQGIVQ